MYNYSLKLIYPNENDTVYRKELLEAFHLTEYTDQINDYIDNLYEEVKEHYIDVIKCLSENDPLAQFRKRDTDGCFMILFSWQYFYDNHEFLRAIFTKSDDILVRKATLINKILSNKK